MPPAPSDARATRLLGTETEGTASALLDRIGAAPSRRLVAAVTGAGRSGKSALLTEAAGRWSAAGIAVMRGLEAIGGNGALIVDDAHELPDEALERLRALAAADGPSLLVAYRARPDRPALRRLVAAIEHHGAPTVLGPLDREGLATAAARDGGAASPAFLDELGTATGGLPWLVHRVLAANPRRTMAPVVPWQVVDRLGYELAELPAAQQGLLLALALGFDAGAAGAALLSDDAAVDGLVDGIRDDGLLLPDGRVVPLIRDAVVRTTPLHRVRSAQRALVDTLAASGRALDRVASTLAQSGLQDPRIAGSLASAGDHLLETRPDAAAALYADALAAGGDEQDLAPRLAQAAWASGDAEAAWHALHPALATPDPELARRATDVAGALWAGKGMLSGAADAYRWRGADTVGSSAPLAALALFGIGDRGTAEEMLAALRPEGAPTLASVALRMLAEGVRDSMGDAAPRALPTLVRASDLFTSSGLTLPVPIAPAVLAATVALGAGELRTAETVLDAAIAGGQGGAVLRPALLLTRAWAAMLADRPDRAREAIDAAGSALEPRDEMLRRALEVGIARRGDDSHGLVRAWHAAREEVLHVGVDLFSLLPLGELIVAAARLRDAAHIDYQADAGFALLDRLGDPPLWGAPLHWAGVQAAILAKQPPRLTPHVAALSAGAGRNRLSAVLAGAGRTWVAVLRGDFETAAVESAARSLASVGMTWDGSRLAGHAAAHAEDRRDMSRLLACARDLHGTPPPPAPAPPEAGGSPAPAAETRGDSSLSPREREVARLVLEGKNYKEIGEAIYISPRTVEHHIARIRQRFSAQSRSDLLTQLRVALDETPAGGDPAARDTAGPGTP